MWWVIGSEPLPSTDEARPVRADPRQHRLNRDLDYRAPMQRRWLPAQVIVLAAATACTSTPHDASYDYGVGVMDRLEGQSSPTGGNTPLDCKRELQAHPPKFAHFNLGHAVQGCLDENTHLNR